MSAISSVVKALENVDIKNWTKKEMKNSALYAMVGRGYNKSKLTTEQLREFLKGIRSKKRLCEVASVSKLKETKEFKSNKHLLKQSRIKVNGKDDERRLVCKIIMTKSALPAKKSAPKTVEGGKKPKKFATHKDSLKKKHIKHLPKTEGSKKRKIKSVKDVQEQAHRSSSKKRKVKSLKEMNEYQSSSKKRKSKSKAESVGY